MPRRHGRRGSCQRSGGSHGGSPWGRTGAAETDDGGEILLLLRARGAFGTRARIGATLRSKKRRRELDDMAQNDTGIEVLAPAGAPIVLSALLDDGMAPHAIVTRLGRPRRPWSPLGRGVVRPCGDPSGWITVDRLTRARPSGIQRCSVRAHASRNKQYKFGPSSAA
jgi:hypothetical protein